MVKPRVLDVWEKARQATYFRCGGRGKENNGRGVTYQERESQAEEVTEGEWERVWWTAECEDERGNDTMR